MSPYPPQLTIPTETSIPDWCSSNHHPSPNTQIIPQPLQGPSIRQRWRIIHINTSLVCFYAGCISSVGLCKRQIQCSLEQFKPKVSTIYNVVFLLFLSIEVNTCNSLYKCACYIWELNFHLCLIVLIWVSNQYTVFLKCSTHWKKLYFGSKNSAKCIHFSFFT